MKPAKQQNEKNKKLRPLRIILIAVITFFVALGIVLLLLVPAYISSDTGRNTILAKINQSVQGKTDFASLSMSWFKGINLTDFAYDDDFGLTSVRIKNISTRPHYAAILTGNLSFGKTVVDEPMVSIDLRKRPAAAIAARPSEEKAPAPLLPVNKMDLFINNGDVKVTDTKSNTVHLAQINSRLDLRGPDKTNSFTADMLVADSGTATPLHSEGAINPTKISGDLAVEVNNLQLTALAPLFDLANLEIDAKGLLTANIKTQFSNSSLQNLTGTAAGSNIDVGGAALKGDRFKTSTLNLDVQMTQQKDLISIDKLSLATDWARVEAAGKIPTDLTSLSQFTEPKAAYDLKAAVDVDLPAVANQMPNILKLKPGTTITSGKLSGNISRTTQADKAQIAADLRITNLAGLVDRQRVAISEPIEAQAVITSDKSAVNFEKLQATSSFAQIKCTGTEKLLAYQATADLQKLQSELGSFLNLGGYKTAGLVTSTGKISTADETINLTGNSTIQNLHLTTPDGQTASEPQADLNMSLDISRKTNDISIKTLACTAGFGDVRIDGGFLPAEKSAKPLSLPITADVDLAKVRPFAMLSSSYPQKLLLSGNAASKLRISIDDQTTKIFTDSTQIQNFSYGTPKTGQVALGLVTAKLDLSAGPDKTTALFDISNPSIKLKGNFNTETARQQTTMTAKADCDYDWKLVGQLLSAFMPEELAIEGKNKTTLEFATSYPAHKPDQLWANLNTKPLNVAFDKAQYRGFTATEPSQIQVQVNNGVLTIPQFSIKVNEGTFSFAGKADFKQTPTVLRTPGPLNILQNVKIDERVSVKLLQYISPIFKDVDRISGTASFSAQTLAIPLKGATKKDLELDGTFSVSDMRLASPIFSVIQKIKGTGSEDSLIQLHPTNITAKDALIKYDNMQLDVGNNPFNFVGRTDLITRSIEGSKVITPYTSGKTIRIGEENTPGRWTVPFKGTYDNPQVDMSKLLQDNLGNIIERGLKEADIDVNSIGDILKNL